MLSLTMDFMGVENKVEDDAKLVKKPFANSPNDDIAAAASKHLHPSKNSPEKKLEELSDEEIMQLTREDCRRYLKQKGMRRPSWNKGQAIQQVLSLRSLCDPKPYHDNSCSPLHMNSDNNKNSGEDLSDTFKSAGATPQAPRCTVQDVNLPNSDLTLSMPSEKKAFEPAATKRSLSPCFDPARKKQMTTGQLPDQALFSGNSSTSSKAPSAQLTMFYAGTVTVFEDLPADKAYAIMLLAKSWPSNTTNVEVPTKQSAMPIVSRQGILELPQARKASLQRFLQKRRQRINQIPECSSKKDASEQPEKMPPTSDVSMPGNCGEQLSGTGEGNMIPYDVEVSSH